MIEKALLSRKIFVLWSCFCLCVCFRQSTVCHSFCLPSARGWGSSRLLLPALCVDHEVGGPERGPGAPPAGRALARCWREVQPGERQGWAPSPPLSGVIKQALNVSLSGFPSGPAASFPAAAIGTPASERPQERPLSPHLGARSPNPRCPWPCWLWRPPGRSPLPLPAPGVIRAHGTGGFGCTARRAPRTPLPHVLASPCLFQGACHCTEAHPRPKRSQRGTFNSITSARTLFPNKGTGPGSREEEVNVSPAARSSQHLVRPPRGRC